jgi:hypothetical protein
MKRADFDFDDASSGLPDSEPLAGTAEGDGDFETDGLPETGETSAGGQVGPPHDTRGGFEGREQRGETHGEPSGFRKVIDEVSTGKIQP